MTRQEFLDAGNRVCVEQSRKQQEVAVNARDDRARAIRESEDVSKETQRRFRQLRPPKELEQPFQELLAERDRFARGLTTQPDLERFTQRTHELALKLGLTRCANG